MYFCWMGNRKKGSGVVTRSLGAVLAITGALVIVLFVPARLWLVLLGGLLIALGFFLWRVG